jgi:bifunctional DNA-binding transcriptional regulator/antitoxin component of YhaV-PrlF toxin-antitoxin module
VVTLHGVTHRVGPKGQVVIPKELRDQLGIEPGDESAHERFRPTEHRRPLAPMMTTHVAVVLVLRYLEDTTPAAEEVTGLLDREKPLMSWINLGEVHYVLRRLHGEDDASETVRDLRDVIDTRLPDERMVIDAARIKADHPMADADAFAAALTFATGAILWSGSPELLVGGAQWRWHDLRS